MRTPASLKGHPIHAMLVPLPIGLWIFALVADVMTHLGRGPGWRIAAFYALGAGVVGALLAAVPGLVDLLSLPKGKTRRVGVIHMSLNLAAVALFGANFLMRMGNADHSGRLLFTALGVAVIAASGWLGGVMVYEDGVGVAAVPSPGPTMK